LDRFQEIFGNKAAALIFTSSVISGGVKSREQSHVNHQHDESKSMKKLKYALAVTAVTAAAAVGLFGSEKKTEIATAKKITVEGLLVDSKCFGMMRSNTGNDHQSPDGLMKGCAAKCAKDGIPVAVLQESGKVLILAAPAKAFAPYMAQHVRVTGTVPFEGTIIPDKVEAQSADGKWKEVEITTMM